MFESLGNTNHLTPIIKGAKYQQTYHAAVVGILGTLAPRVSSRGTMFFNHDRWTLRVFVKFFCEWAKKNPGCVPVLDNVRDWVSSANAENVPSYKREIVVASTPESLPLRTALALTGGAYHEAAHTWTSCRRDLNVDEMFSMVIPRWAKVADWSRYAGALLEWSNIIEDVRIERCLRVDFEGTYVKLCDLQDFILNQEEDNRTKTGFPLSDLNIISATFRDVGLGYPTTIQKEALDRYRKENSKAVEMVLNGPLTPFLKETIELPKSDDLSCLRLAMDVIVTLGELAKQDAEQNKSKNGQPGDGKKTCPKCGASAGNLKVRPKSDGKGGKVKNKGIVTCTVCGWQDEIDLKLEKPQPKKGLDPGDEETPDYDGFEESDFDQNPEEGKSGKSQKGKKDKKNSKEGSSKSDETDDSDETEESEGSSKGKKDKKDSDSDETEASGGGDEDDDSAGDEDSADSGDGSADGEDEGEDGDGEGDEGSESGGDGSVKDPGDHDDDGTPQSELGKAGKGAGGYQHDPNPVSGQDFVDVATSALSNADKEGATGLQDAATALQEALSNALAHEDKTEVGEQAWRPYDPTMDEAVVVSPSAKGKDSDQTRARNLCDSVKAECAYLRARLRSVIRSLEQTGVARGVPKGRRLSDRYLVDTKVSLMAGSKPKRPFDEKGERFDASMAAAVVMDESGSMGYDNLAAATKIFISITEPLDGLGFPTLAFGFRDGGKNSNAWGGGYHPYGNPVNSNGDTRECHRDTGITWDIFKGWNERFTNVMWRFANTRGCGSTPMADGIQYALMALSQRDEAHRIMFVVTDGCPNHGDYPIIKRQLRLAREAGIHVIGVGMGYSATDVRTLFPDHVWSEELSEFPRLLVQKINDLVDIRAAKRGIRVKKD